LIKLVIGIVFIIGGLSGKMAMRGTNSPTALAALGAGLCIWGVFEIMGGAKERGRKRRSEGRRTRRTRSRLNDEK
jgi:hypothetical protein